MPRPSLPVRACLLALSALLASTLGCSGLSSGTGDTGGTGQPSAASVTGLRLEPENPTVSVSPGAPTELAFNAVILRDDGSEEPTTLVTWTASNAALGNISGDGLFTTFDDRGGTTNVTAQYFGYEASTLLTVVYTQDYDGVPLAQGARDLFAGTATTAGEDGPHVIYPGDGVVIPKNQPELLFMWNPGVETGQANLFRLNFSSPIMSVSVYTEGTSWNTDPELWRIISSSNAGGEIKVRLTGVRYHVEDGVAVADTAPVEAPEIDIRVDRLDATGSIYYFSASDNGIKRIDLDRRGSEEFLTAIVFDANCVSCHVLSPDGTKMALSYRTNDLAYAAVMDITSGSQDAEILLEDEPGDLMTWSPDGEWLLLNDDGTLKLFTTDGWVREDVAVNQYVAQPEWSPDGDRIVVAVVTAIDYLTTDSSFYQAGIGYLSVVGPGQIDPNPVMLVESDGVTNNYFPTFSPDGEWIAFTRATNDASYWAESAEVWLVHKDGGEPIRLDQANGGTGWQNSWPRWAPLSDSDYLWLTFSSIRPYGFYNLEEGNPQIWVTAIDEAMAGTGVDPSASSFWLVDQDPDSHNHIPVWGP